MFSMFEYRLKKIINQKIKEKLNIMYKDLSFLENYNELVKNNNKNNSLKKDLILLQESDNKENKLYYKITKDLKEPYKKNIKMFFVTELYGIKMKFYIFTFRLSSEEPEIKVKINESEVSLIEVTYRFFTQERFVEYFLEENELSINSVAKKVFRNQLNNFLSSKENNDNVKF